MSNNEEFNISDAENDQDINFGTQKVGVEMEWGQDEITVKRGESTVMQRRNNPLLLFNAIRCSIDVFQHIVARMKKEDLDVIDDDGQSALYLVAKDGKVGMIRCLLEKGANPNIKNYDGKIPLEASEDSAIIELIKRAIQEKSKKEENNKPFSELSTLSNIYPIKCKTVGL